jgi:multidrug resistance efflux pump
MENSNINNIILSPEQLDVQLQQMKKYKNNIEQLTSQLNPILEEFQNAYVNYHMNPTNNETEQIFQTSNSNMQSLNSQLFSIDNSIQQNIHTIDKNLIQLNKKIQQAKNENQKLNRMYNRTNSKQEGSVGMVYEFNEIYRRDYLTNVNLFVGVILSLYLTIKMFGDRKLE